MDPADETPPEQMRKNLTSTYPCHFCGKEIRRCNYQRHISRSHFYCNICDKFVSVRKHQNVHKDREGPEIERTEDGRKKVNLGVKRGSTVAALCWLPVVMSKEQAKMLQPQQDFEEEDKRLDLPCSEMVRAAVHKMVIEKCFCTLAGPDGMADCVCKLTFDLQLQHLLTKGYGYF